MLHYVNSFLLTSRRPNWPYPAKDHALHVYFDVLLLFSARAPNELTDYSPLTIFISALAASATNVHNQYGVNGWIQDSAGTDVQLNNGQSTGIGGGWGFFWISSSDCSDNSVAFTWPSNYGDVYIKSDGYLYDAGITIFALVFERPFKRYKKLGGLSLGEHAESHSDALTAPGDTRFTRIGARLRAIGDISRHPVKTNKVARDSGPALDEATRQLDRRVDTMEEW
ncbi:hypothetical protein G7Y89_g5283 [Cudoniella acicularis]|uniref:Uncharacterized protein n=1 Tax=Cudoniella acicularis TaxID=354080 RepID=A0A8H4RQY0_9HELO|nr:hypothetical protein G7Y89_g5283 [Cudoniella acicularis]